MNNDTTRNVSANITGWEKSPETGDINNVDLQTDMNERSHECPKHGKTYSVNGKEGAILRSRTPCGQERTIMAAGDGGLGMQLAPGDTLPRMGMYVNGGGALTNRLPGGDPKGVAMRLNGNMLLDPHRNIQHVARDFDTGMIGGDEGLY